MKRCFLSTLMPLIATILVLCFTVANAEAQSDKAKYAKILKVNFKNTTNSFKLKGVGNVIVKGSSDKDIHCEVHMEGYGSTPEAAKREVDNVQALAAKDGSPKLEVSLRNGRYNENRCKVVSTLYLPSTVSFLHNESFNMEDLLYKAVDKMGDIYASFSKKRK